MQHVHRIGLNWFRVDFDVISMSLTLNESNSDRTVDNIMPINFKSIKLAFFNPFPQDSHSGSVQFEVKLRSKLGTGVSINNFLLTSFFWQIEVKWGHSSHTTPTHNNNKSFFKQIKMVKNSRCVHINRNRCLSASESAGNRPHSQNSKIWAGSERNVEKGGKEQSDQGDG